MKIRKPSIKEVCYFITILIIICSIIPILILGIYSHPSADDFNYSKITFEAVRNGKNLLIIVGKAIKLSYTYMKTWQGLYTSAFLLALQPAIFGEHFYSLTIWILIASLLIGVFSLMKNIYKYVLKINNKDWIVVALIITDFLIQTIPSAAQGLYWFNGAVNYTFFLGYLLLKIALLFRYVNENSKINYYLIAGFSFCAFSISGGNHITAFENIAVDLLFVLYTVIKRKKWWTINSLIMSITGFLINITSKGTKIRKACMGYNGTIVNTLEKSYEYTVDFVQKSFSKNLIVLLLILTPFIVMALKEFLKKTNIKFRHLIISLVFSFGLEMACVCIPYYAMGNFGAPRVLNIFYFNVIILSIINYILLICSLYTFIKDKVEIKLLDKGKRILSTVWIFVVIGTFFISFHGTKFNDFSLGKIAYLELKSKVPQAYNEEMNQRVRKYLDENSKEIEVDEIKNKETLLFFDDITEDNEFWENKAIRKYYNKDKIVVKLNKEE